MEPNVSLTADEIAALDGIKTAIGEALDVIVKKIGEPAEIEASRKAIFTKAEGAFVICREANTRGRERADDFVLSSIVSLLLPRLVRADASGPSAALKLAREILPASKWRQHVERRKDAACYLHSYQRNVDAVTAADSFIKAISKVLANEALLDEPTAPPALA